MATESSRAARQLLPPVSSRLQAGALRSNRERYIQNALRRKQVVVLERLAYLVALFKDQPCSDCGETDPLVLEFDHIEAKRFSVSQGIRDRSWQSVMDEIAKCEVVCANCHRRRTARRGGFARSAAVAQR